MKNLDEIKGGVRKNSIRLSIHARLRKVIEAIDAAYALGKADEKKKKQK